MSTDQQSDEADNSLTFGLDSEVPSEEPNNASSIDDDNDDEFAATENDEESEELATSGLEDFEEEEEEEGDQLGPMMSESEKKERPSPVRQGSIKGEQISNVLDMETGKLGGHRASHAVLRAQESMTPRSVGERRRRNLTKPLRNSLLKRDEEQNELQTIKGRGGGHVGVLRNQESMRPQSAGQRRLNNIFKPIKNLVATLEGDEDEEEDGSSTLSMHRRLKVEEKNQGAGDVETGRQYHLEAVHPHQRPGTRIANWLGLGTTGAMYFDDRTRGCCFGITPNHVVMNYLHWSFRSSFTAVMLSAALGFLGLTMIFAFFIWRIGVRHPQCIGGVDFENDYFMDAVSNFHTCRKLSPSPSPSTVCDLMRINSLHVSVRVELDDFQYSRLRADLLGDFSGQTRHQRVHWDYHSGYD